MAKRVSRRRFIAASGATAATLAAGGLVQWLEQRSDAIMPSPTPTALAWVDDDVDGYLAVAPRTLRPGRTASVSLALLRGARPARSTVTVSLLKDKDGRPLAAASGRVSGRGSVPLGLPALAEGDYTLRVEGRGFRDEAPVRVEDGTLVFVETDKPIYRPGQTVHIRLLALDPTLRPASGQATVEVVDASGVKVFKRAVAIDAVGMASVDLPLSSEPNLGVWKVQATLGRRRGQVDVRVERYVLPKYEVRLDLPRAWALAGEPIRGTVTAEYTFGKPVKGEVEVVARRYVGDWQEYARVSRPIDGSLAVEVPAVGYAAGAPAAGGLGRVRLDVTVREQATGYEEQTSELVTIAASPVTLRLVPESSTFKPGLPFALLVVAETPGKQPVDADVEVRLRYQGEQFQT
ncbi:MAG: twin-arginine translocation signal domain-containing protein, partial [Thermomicrobiaceae bacterium]|nr:twin-arginine translocation signal domain-containing protein [Thermomicrobiaceae bacterium]